MTGLMPFVSVILPVRNEEEYIAACLRSLISGSYPSDRWEIIIADGMSRDGTREQIARVARESPVPIRVIDNPRGITPIGLNLAIGQTRGSIIIRVDAHARYPDDYVATCVGVLEETCADNVGGPVSTHPGADDSMARAIALAMAHPFGVGNSAFRTGRQAKEVDTVPYGCFRADVFQRIGLFDERLARNQDYDLNQRIRAVGGHIWLDPRLESIYYSRPTLQRLLRQARDNGFWNALTHYLRPGSFCVRHALPVVFSLGIMLAVVLLLLAVATAQLWVVVLCGMAWGAIGGYLLANLWTATSLARRHGWALWPALLVVFPVFHFVYGMGVARGWVCALHGSHPWRPEDGVPSWDERRREPEMRTAA